ncbi:hypothetical protein L1049_012215 [Liquidambar formosana]|uniref:Uncharacterized protein n=1 Tax=Liquidambar formosana TaxID=63359 RepID=A0AAP0WYM8_LIQFO
MVAVRFGDLMEEEDLFGFGNTLRHIARRHRLLFPVRQRSVDSSFSPTQMAEAEAGLAGPANSVETVSSWPVDGGVALSGGGGGEDGDIGVSGRASEDADTLMSEIRVSGSLSTN